MLSALYSHMTDLLFYLPHNTSLLYDCPYAFDPPGPAPYPYRPTLDPGQVQAVKAAHDDFQKALDKWHDTYFALGFLDQMGIPNLHQPGDLNAKDKEQDKANFRAYRCIAAGIQY